jgi:hypothetical protein
MNASQYFVPGILATDPRRPCTRKVQRAPLRCISAGTNISESDCVTPFAIRQKGIPAAELQEGWRILLMTCGCQVLVGEPSVSSCYGIDMIALTGTQKGVRNRGARVPE